MKGKSRVSAGVRLSVLASAISAILLNAGEARGQEQPQPPSQQQAQSQPQSQLEEVVVTGSRIARRDFSANSPIMTLDSERFKESSTISMESVLNQMPQFVPAVTQFQPVPSGELSNSGGPTITPTASTVSLRGLGSNRNLVLLDGRRAMPVDASMSVDINTIPSAAIARVETITGGASAVYGADAVAGVVNFILKKNLEGFNFDAQYGETQRGDGQESEISVAFGQNFGKNGNLLIGLEHYRRGRVWQKNREFYTDGWADPGSQGGIQVFYTAPYVNDDPANPFSQQAIDGIFEQTTPGSVASTGNFYLNADGSVYTTGPAGNYRYNGPTRTADGKVYRFVRSDNGQLSENWVDQQESAPETRDSFFGRAQTDLTENVTAFAQAMFSDTYGQFRRRVGGMVGGWGGTVPHGDDIYAPSLDANGNTLPEYLPGGRYGLNCPAVGGCSKSQVWPVSPEMEVLLDSRPDPEAPATVGIATTWFGNVRNSVRVRSYQMVAGFDGKLPNKDWTWEFYLSRGESTTENEYVGTTSLQRWRYVINQPNYGKGLYTVGNAEGNGFGAGAITCTSGFSTLGQGEEYYLAAVGYSDARPSQDCLDAVGADMAAVGHLMQTVGEFNVQGGLAQLPAGDLRFALGADYRDDDFRWMPPPMNTPESIFDTPAGQYPRSETNGSTSTSELYGELLVPLLHDKPGARDMSLELGYRYSRNDPTENVGSYKALLDWQVAPKFRIRGGHQIANRAPNVAELYQSANERLLVGTQGDWCSDLNPVNPLSPNPQLNPNAAQAKALCSALMGPRGAATFYSDPNRSADAVHYFFANISGNPDVQRETATTDTLGLVANVTDRATLTIDYWRIQIEDMISSQNPDAIYRQCLSPATNPTYDPSFAPCAQLVRDPFTGGEGNTDLVFTNQGAIDFSGYDIQFDWSHDLGPGLLNVSTVATITGDTRTRVSPDSAWTDWKGTSGPSDLSGLSGWSYPWRTFVSGGYSVGPWSGSLRWRHLPSIRSEGTVNNPTSTFQPTHPYDVFDVSGSYSAGKMWNLRFGIDNLFDRQPEKAFPDATDTATGETNTNFYDILGRRFYVGLTVKL